jgi:hypothetical protein
MEGTLGAAEHVLLRGRVCKAALSSEPAKVGAGAAPVRKRDAEASSRGGVTFQSRRPRARDKRCPSRSGWGKAPEASNRVGGSRQVKSQKRRSLARETSVPYPRKGLAGLGGTPTVRSVIEAESSVGSSVVLANRYDCRSRRAARGVERSRAMSPRKRRRLVSRLRGAKERRKPSLDGKVQALGWRARARGAVKAEPSEHSSIEGVLSRENHCPLTGRWRKRFWLVSKGFRPGGDRRQGTSEVDSHSSSAAEKAAAAERRAEGPSIGEPTRNPRRSRPCRKTGDIVRESSEAGNASSNAVSLESCAGASLRHT